MFKSLTEILYVIEQRQNLKGAETSSKKHSEGCENKVSTTTSTGGRMSVSKEGVVNIRGKSYTTVAMRVHNFREDHPDWGVETEIISIDADTVVMRAVIKNDAGRIIGMGHAEERRKASQINQTSALENCETSAIGRALASIDYGGTEYASANEVENAIHQQKGKSVAQIVREESGPIDETYLDPHEAGLRSALHKYTNSTTDEAMAEAVTLAKDAVRDLDGDHKVALWQRFDSKERRILTGMLK